MSGRIGIRGFRITANGIVYAKDEADGLARLAASLKRVAEATPEEREDLPTVFARGGLRIEEIEASTTTEIEVEMGQQ